MTREEPQSVWVVEEYFDGVDYNFKGWAPSSTVNYGRVVCYE